MDKRMMNEIGPSAQKNLSESIHELHDLSMIAARKLHGLLEHLRGSSPEADGTGPHLPGIMGGVDLCSSNLRSICQMINELTLMIGYTGDQLAKPTRDR